MNLRRAGELLLLSGCHTNKPLLLQKDAVRSIVDDFTAKDVFGHVIVGFSGRRQVLLGVEDKLVSIGTQEHGDLLADHSKGEYIAVLFLTVLQELDGVATGGTRLDQLK